MKTRRWLKSVIATAKNSETGAPSLPWQRGTPRAVMVAKRDPKHARRA